MFASRQCRRNGFPFSVIGRLGAFARFLAECGDSDIRHRARRFCPEGVERGMYLYKHPAKVNKETPRIAPEPSPVVVLIVKAGARGTLLDSQSQGREGGLREESLECGNVCL